MKTPRTKSQKLASSNVVVQEHIQVHLMFEGDKGTGWVHTHGMWEKFQLPDLEIIGIAPRFLMTGAGGMLNHIAQYMIDAKFGVGGARPPAVGQTMGMGHGVIVKFELAKPQHPNDEDENAGHYTNPRWRVVEVPEMFQCHGCDDHEKHAQPRKKVTQ